MQYHRVVGGIGVVVVAVPVARSHVYFHIACPHLVAYHDFGIEEIGTGTGVEFAGVDDPHTRSGTRRHVQRLPQSVLPDVLHKFFHGVEGIDC